MWRGRIIGRRGLPAGFRAVWIGKARIMPLVRVTRWVGQGISVLWRRAFGLPSLPKVACPQRKPPRPVNFAHSAAPQALGYPLSNPSRDAARLGLAARNQIAICSRNVDDPPPVEGIWGFPHGCAFPIGVVLLVSAGTLLAEKRALIAINAFGETGIAELALFVPNPNYTINNIADTSISVRALVLLFLSF